MEIVNNVSERRKDRLFQMNERFVQAKEKFIGKTSSFIIRKVFRFKMHMVDVSSRDDKDGNKSTVSFVMADDEYKDLVCD